MTTPPGPAPPDPGPLAADAEPGVRGDVPAALTITVALAVIGALLGVVWAAWSPAGGLGLVRAPGAIQPDETENWVAGDGRFLVLAAIVGVVAGALAWTRTHNRGPLVLAALAVGGLAGSLLMELVGHLTGGGTFDGDPNTIIKSLPLSLHMPGLVFLESGVAVLVYGMLAAFAVRDDLGRPDPTRDSLVQAAQAAQAARDAPVPASPDPAPEQPWPSVGPGDHPQHGGGDGDAPGVLQQRDLPPQ